MNSHSNKPMMKKPRTVTASDHDHADCAALTLLFGNEHILLHLSLFVVLPLPYLCKACAEQGGSSFTSAHVYALSRHESHRRWTSCKFSESFVFMMELVKRQPHALRLASAALQDDREIVLEAVKQDGRALKYTSAELRNGGLREYLNHLKSNVFNVPKQTFIATILFGAKAAPSIPGSPRDSRSCLCDNSKCVLSLLRPSVRVPGSMSLQIKKLIWEYAGVRSGPKWDVIDGADTNI